MRVVGRWEPHPNGMPPGEVVQAAGYGGARLRAAAGAAGEGIAQRIEQREGERAGRSSGALLHNGRRCDIGETEPVEGDAGVADAGAFAILQQHRAGFWLCRPQRRQRDGDPACQDDDQPPRGGFGGTQEPQDGDVEMARQDTGAARVAAGAQKGSARSSPPRHGDKAGQDVLQRCVVLVDRRPVLLHPPPLSRQGKYCGALGKVDKRAWRKARAD